MNHKLIYSPPKKSKLKRFNGFKKLKTLFKKAKWRLKWFKILPGIILVLAVIWLWTKLVIASPSNIITKIQFKEEDLKFYDNPELFAQITSFLSGKNIILASQNLNSFTLQLQNQFPIVQGIKITKSSPNTALVDIEFENPNIVIQLSWQLRWSKNEIFFPIPLTSQLAKDQKIPRAQLPERYEDFPLSWFFFKIDEAQLAHHLQNLTQTFTGASIIYLPGGSKYIVNWQDKTLYFDWLKNIQDQIATFKLFEANQNKLKPQLRNRIKADVGSLSWAIIISQ